MRARVYVLRSLTSGKRYVGLTSKSVEVRLREHNSGSNAWTKHNRPFKLLYCEEFEDRTEAAMRERFLKSGAGRKLLDRLTASD